MKGIKEIRDEEIIETFLLGDQNRAEKVIHGILRKNDEVIVIFERLGSGGYSGFSEKSHLKFSSLNDKQVNYLKSKGYLDAHEV